MTSHAEVNQMGASITTTWPSNATLINSGTGGGASDSSNSSIGNNPVPSKRPRFYYFRLESESSDKLCSSDTETIYSVQSKETECVRDTSDTSSRFSDDDEADILEIEYDVAATSEEEKPISSDDSTNSIEDGIIFAAAAMCNTTSNGETWVADFEDSDSSDSSVDSSPAVGVNFWCCLMCKSQNLTPEYRLCEKCFHSRKTSLPPRPRRRKAKTLKNSNSFPPKVFNERASQDSGLGCNSSGAGSSFTNSNCTNDKRSLGSDTEMIDSKRVKYSLSTRTSTQDSLSTSRTDSSSSRMDDSVVVDNNCPQNNSTTASTSNNSSTNLTNRRIYNKSVVRTLTVGNSTRVVRSRRTSEVVVDDTNAATHLCIVCNQHQKDSIFLHGRTSHMSCCYACAVRTWKTIKRCPICNRKVSNIVKVFNN